MSLTAIRARVASICKGIPPAIVSVGDPKPGPGGIQIASDQDGAIQDAVKQFSKDKPRRLTVAIPAVTGVYEYNLSQSLPGWGDAYSIHRIVFPGGQRYENEIQDKFFKVYRQPAPGAYDPSGDWFVKFFAYMPSSPDSMWIDVRYPHALSLMSTDDPQVDTIAQDYPNDVDAFNHLCAANVFRIAAAWYAENYSSTITANNVEYDQRNKFFNNLADREMDKYHELIADETAAMAGRRVNWDVRLTGRAPQFFWRPEYT